MTTHLRARVLQAGAFLALIGGVLVAAPSAALAISPSVTVSSLSSGDIPSGGKTTLSYKVSNRNLGTSDAETVTVVVTANGMTCNDKCNFDDPIAPGAVKEYSVTLTANDVAAGQTQNTQIRVTATINGDSGSVSRNVTLRGPDAPQVVRQVSGKVKDQDGKAVSGAQVALRDRTQRTFNTTTNGEGGYSFTSTDSEPIAVGELFVGATKVGYNIAKATAQGKAGKSINVPLTIKLTAAASPSVSPSVSTSTSAEPTDEVTDDAGATDGESAAAIDAKPTSGDDEGSGSMLFIILGGLLVAAGIGAIVLVLMRRKSGDEADDADDADGVGTVPPVGGGRYAGAGDTRLAGAPMGARPNEATMIAPRSGAPSIGDAPTMIHRAPPVVDEFPDPYGAPMPQGGGYNAPGGWGAAGATAGAYGAAAGAEAYGNANQYGGAPVPAQNAGYGEPADEAYGGNAYGAPQGGYNEPAGYDQAAPYGAPQGGGYDQQPPQQRYDEPTGMYRPEPGGYPAEAGYADPAGYGGAEPAYGQPAGYGQAADDYAAPGPARGGAYQGGGNGYAGGAYGAPAEPVDQGGGYGSWDGQGGAVDNGNAYGPPAGGGNYGGQAGYGGNGNYGAPAGGGYDQADGYGADQGGYDPRAAYGRPEGYDQPPAGRGQQPPGGYVDQGGYGADQGGYYGAEQQGNRHGGPPPEATRPGQRRPLDWMDD
jgi:hypothetical protein